MKNRIGSRFSGATPRALWSRLAPRRKPRPERAPDPSPAADLGRPLRAFRAAALWAIAVVVAVADGAAFSESYRGLFEWAQHHNLSGFWAAAFPLQVDLFIVVGELVLFIAMIDRWDRKDRLGAWAVALLGLAVSIAGNVGHIQAHDLQSRGTAAVPPVAAFGALWLGLGVLKRILRRRQGRAVMAAQDAQAAARSAQATAERDALAAVLDELSGAVLLLAERGANPPPQPAPDTAHIALLGELLEAVQALGERPDAATREPAQGDAQTALLAELLDAVRTLGERDSDTVSSPVPADAEDAALIAMKATVAAGNPLSVRQLEVRYGLTRARAIKVREAAGVTEPRLPALNGSGAGA